MAHLLRQAPCNILLSSQRYTPPVDVAAEASMLWTEPATRLLTTAPDFARGIARTTIHRWAMERGHSVITRKIVEQAMGNILPRSSMIKMGIIAEDAAAKEIKASDSVTYICAQCGYAARDFEPVKCAVCGSAREAFQKLDKQAIEQLRSLEGGVEESATFDDVKLKWTKDAREELRRVPDGYQMRRAKAQIEKRARVQRVPTITRQMVLAVTEVQYEETRHLAERGSLKTPGANGGGPRDAPAAPAMDELIADGDFLWTPRAKARLDRVPEGFMRSRTRERVEGVARSRNTTLITLGITEEGIKEGLKLMEEMMREQAGS